MARLQHKLQGCFFECGDEVSKFDLRELFVSADLSENAKEQFNNVRENIARFERILEFPNEPECDIDMHCY